MHGTNLSELIALRCCVCRKWFALRVDPDDLERYRNGVLVQFAFTNEDGTPYLCAALRELFVSQVCPDCWVLLCPDPITHPTHYN